MSKRKAPANDPGSELPDEDPDQYLNFENQPDDDTGEVPQNFYSEPYEDMENHQAILPEPENDPAAAAASGEIAMQGSSSLPQDPRERRTIINWKSAAKSREKEVQNTAQLERDVPFWQTDWDLKNEQLSFMKNNVSFLRMENIGLKAKLSAKYQHRIQSVAKHEKLVAVVTSLSELQLQQQEQQRQQFSILDMAHGIPHHDAASGSGGDGGANAIPAHHLVPGANQDDVIDAAGEDFDLLRQEPVQAQVVMPPQPQVMVQPHGQGMMPQHEMIYQQQQHNNLMLAQQNQIVEQPHPDVASESGGEGDDDPEGDVAP